MIARATLALMLSCPPAALWSTQAAAAPDRMPIPTTVSAVKRERAVATRRARAVTHHRALRRHLSTVSATLDDGLAYDTPRGPDGRPVASAIAGPIGLALHPIESGALQTGLASWYGGRRWQGRPTSDGGRYDENALTAAHATLPLGSQVRVRLVDSDREVIVTVTDRPGTRRRIIDLSRAAAAALGILSRGVAEVSLEPLRSGQVSLAQN